MNDNEVAMRVTNGNRMPRPEKIPKEVFDIMMGCWKTDPSERLTFATLSDLIENFAAGAVADYIETTEQEQYSIPKKIHRKKKWYHFDLKSLVTGETKNSTRNSE